MMSGEYRSCCGTAHLPPCPIPLPEHLFLWYCCTLPLLRYLFDAGYWHSLFWPALFWNAVPCLRPEPVPLLLVTVMLRLRAGLVCAGQRCARSGHGRLTTCGKRAALASVGNRRAQLSVFLLLPVLYIH